MRIEHTVIFLSKFERGILPIAWLALLLVLSLVPAGTVMADSAGTSHAYRIGPNDLIRIQVFGEDDLTVESKVAGDGTINFPLLGSVSVAGQSVKELQEYLAGRLAEGYVRLPKVTVLMVRYRNFYMTGEVKTPGGYPYESGLTVQKAISLAGGFTEKAETRKIAATRVVGNQTDTITLGLDSPILPDDILTVGAMQRFYVTGEVKTPGRYPFEQGLTIQKALSMAGGVTEKADSTAVKITRLSETTVKTLAVGSDEVIFPDDLIVVEGQHRRFYVSGEVKMPGGYPYKEGLSVQKALAMAGGLTDKAEKNELRVIRQVDGREESMAVTFHSSLLAEDTIVVAEGQRFYVSGEVSKPGRYIYESGLTVQKALSMGGGFTEKADKAGITVNRLQGGAVRTLALDNQALLMPDDEIVVPQLRKVFVEGEVKKPGHLSYEKGMTVHMAIAMAGGFTDKAAKTSTKVLRSIDGQERAIDLALDSPILPEDIIVVPQRFF